MSAWVLVPKMLTQAMAQAIRDAADNRRFESWPANCWEDAIAVAPKPSAVGEVQKFSAALTLCPSGYVVRAEDYDALAASNQQLLEQITEQAREIANLNASRVPEGPAGRRCNKCGYWGQMETHNRPDESGVCGYLACNVQPAHSKAVLIDRELFDGSEV